MTDIKEESGYFTVLQDGMLVASGSGDLESVRKEAAHYALMYGQDGPVTVRIRRVPKKKPKMEARP